MPTDQVCFPWDPGATEEDPIVVEVAWVTASGTKVVVVKAARVDHPLTTRLAAGVTAFNLGQMKHHSN